MPFCKPNRPAAAGFFAAAAIAAAVSAQTAAPVRKPVRPGRGFFPKGLTKAEVEAYVAAHPDQKAAIYDEHTVVRRGPGKELKLTTVPYHVEYGRWLEAAAQDLRAAADLSDDPVFAK